MPRETIRIVTTDGFEMVRADVFGPLAIHRGVNGKGLQNVTHVATGKAVIRNLTKQDAAAFIIRTKHLDWTAPEEALKAYKAVVAEASKDIAYGRGVASR